MLYIITGSRWSMGQAGASIIRTLEDKAGAEVIELHPYPPGGSAYVSKLQTARMSLTPRLIGLRGRWTRDDVVLVIGWYLLPILLLVRMGLLPPPRRLVSLATFLHGRRLRQAVNRYLRALMPRCLEFIVFSEAERANLVDVVRMAPSRVHRVVFRGTWSDDQIAHDGRYVFTGGHTNRDYPTFFDAVADLRHDVVVVASPLNDVRAAAPNVDLRIGTPLDEFETLLAGCSVLVLPLHASGEACGQTVLLSGIRYRKPVVATRHDALVDYLGTDYPGFVDPYDAGALRGAIERAMSDDAFRSDLLDRIDAARRMLHDRGDLEQDFLRVLAPSNRRDIRRHGRETSLA